MSKSRSAEFGKILISSDTQDIQRLLVYKGEISVCLDDVSVNIFDEYRYSKGKIDYNYFSESEQIMVLDDGLTTFNLSNGDFWLYENGELFFTYENGIVVYDKYKNIGSPTYPPINPTEPQETLIGGGISPNPDDNTTSNNQKESDIKPNDSTTSNVTDTAATTSIINNYYYFINNTYVTNVTNITIINAVENNYIYNNDYNVITNYSPGEVIKISGEYRGIDIQGSSFFLKSGTSILEIQNARDKFIGYSGDDGNVAAYSYVAGNGGAIDGRDKSQVELMIGADNADNQIYAGNGGSSLWGGVGGNDILSGGSGYDEFFYAIGSGNDVIQNADNNDLVNLVGINLSQISGVNVNIGQVDIYFVDGGKLQINGSDGIRYQIAEGTFGVNQSTKQWSAR